MDLRDREQWSFVGGAWQESDEGIIEPPGKMLADDQLGFFLGKMYSDVEAEFEFRWNTSHCGAGLVVRAQDTSHYYLVHFPNCGQYTRGKNFAAAVSKSDGAGWLEILKMDLVHGVPSEQRMWHKVRVIVEGNQIRLWVDGRPFPVVCDDDYEEGYVGLESWTWGTVTKAKRMTWGDGTVSEVGPGSSFRNLKVRGKDVPAKPWDETLLPPKPWFHPYPVGDGQQSTSGIVRAPSGELLMALSWGGIAGVPSTPDAVQRELVRSTDNGRSWAPVEAEGWPGGWLHATRDGRLIAIIVRDNHILLAGSEDNGNAWSKLEDRAEIAVPEGVKRLGCSMGPPVELEDGTLVMFLLSGHESTSGEDIREWGSVHLVAYSMRSTDGGQTWEGPTTLDGPPGVGVNLDLTEASGALTPDGRILCLTRPVYSPWMWETWSEDGGASWGPTTRGSFPSYNCAMLPHPTASGALMIGGRMPGLGLHVSHDNGMTWTHYQAGTDIWAGQRMYEVEPDVVLWVYMDSYGTDARAQFIRITPDGAEPAREMLP